MKEAVGIVFQNLNGFQAGRSLSQSVVPSRTQTSFLSLSQISRAPHGGGTQTSSLDLCPRSPIMEMSQKSIMESMSQSIRLSVKKNRRRTIPNTRYLTLRVEFTNSVSPNELPPSLKQYRLETSPTSIIGGNADEPLTGASNLHTNRFVVTPLGKIKFHSAVEGVLVRCSIFLPKAAVSYRSGLRERVFGSLCRYGRQNESRWQGERRR